MEVRISKTRLSATAKPAHRGGGWRSFWPMSIVYSGRRGLLTNDAQVLGGIPSDSGVGCQKRKILGNGLGDQRAVEGVQVDGRKVVDCRDMFRAEEERLEKQGTQGFLPPQARVADV